MEVPNFSDLQDLEAMWALWDEDGSGELDKDEFSMALKMLQVSEGRTASGTADLLFSGSHTFQCVSQVDDIEDIDRIYRDIDDDGNGTISMDEFAAWWFNDQSSGTAAKSVRRRSSAIHNHSHPLQKSEQHQENTQVVTRVEDFGKAAKKMSRKERAAMREKMWIEQLRISGISK